MRLTGTFGTFASRSRNLVSNASLSSFSSLQGPQSQEIRAIVFSCSPYLPHGLRYTHPSSLLICLSCSFSMYLRWFSPILVSTFAARSLRRRNRGERR